MKRDGRKIVGVVCWDAATAGVLDQAGVDLVSVGDSIAVSLWGRAAEGDLSFDELLLFCRAVRGGSSGRSSAATCGTAALATRRGAPRGAAPGS